MLEIRPKVEEITTENLMLYFAECIKKYCSEREGTFACKDCPFYKENYGCKIASSNPEEWSVRI